MLHFMREQVAIVLTVARDPTLARIQLAYLGFNMAEAATWVAILVYGYALGGAAAAGIVALAQLVPSGLVAPFAAYAGDRYRRDRVLLASYALLAITCGATAVALYQGLPAPLTIAIATTAAIGFTLVRPVQSAILPSITHSPADLTAANTVSGLIEALGLCLGPLVGGLVLIRAAPGDVFAVFAVVSLASAALVLRIPVSEGGQQLAPVRSRQVVAGVFGGFGVLARERRARLVVVVLATVPLVTGALDILYVATTLDLFHAGQSWAGFFYSAFGFGGIAGALLAVTLVGRRRLTPAMATSGGVFGLSIAAVGQAPSLLLAAALFSLTGAGWTLNGVAGRTLLQRVAPEAALSRVFGVLEGIAMFALAAGSVASGIITYLFGVPMALLVVGLVLPLVMTMTWRSLGALDRNARAPDPVALALLRRSPIFAPLSAPSMERILAELTWRDVPEGELLIREVGVGDGVGEIALLRDVPRTATITARTPLRVIAIERERFLEAVLGHAQARALADEMANERLARDEAAAHT